MAGIEPGEFRCHAVGLMGGHDDGAAIADGHLRLADIPTDVLLAGPDFVPLPAEPDASPGRAGPVHPAIGERLLIAPGRDADRLQPRPGIGHGAAGQVDDQDAPVEQRGVARIALDHRGVPSIR